MKDKLKQERLRKLLKKVAPDKNLESLAPPTSGLESSGDSQAPDAQGALYALERGQDLTKAQLNTLEAIILPGERPVIDIKNDKYLRPGEPFSHLHRQEYRQRIEPTIKSIGRVELPNHPSAPYGGTAFMVGDGLMMTNRHVAEIFATGLGEEVSFRGGLTAGIDLKKEIGDDEDDAIVFNVEDIVMIHPYWDMALLKVSGLDGVSPLTLSIADPRDLIDDDVAVIGYPALDPRNEIDLQNQIFRSKFNVKRMQPGKIGERAELNSYSNLVNTVTHDSSTLGGNSGSAVVHADSGDVVALHFAGIYLDANYAVPTMELARDRHVVDAGVNFAGDPRPASAPWDHLWIAAETSPQRKVRQPPEPSSGDDDGQSAGSVGAQKPIQTVLSGSCSTWTIPIHVTVQLGDVAMAISDAQASPDKSSSGAGIVEKLVEPFHETDYSDRPGYDENFLGLKLRLPKVSSKRTVAKMKDGGDHIIPYYHYSLVMHKHRRLAIFTASNIDGRPDKREPEPGKKYTRKVLAGMTDRDREKWFNDPRISDEHQLPNVFYDLDRQAFDKGHLVRRDDVTWGDSHKDIMKANGDTFHVTNCSPQVAKFNRSNRSGIWGKLENEVLKQAERDDEMYSVFSGPVLKDTDPVFEGEDDEFLIDVQIPTSFWKVIVVNNDNTLEAYAFLLDQELDDVDFDDDRELAFNSAWKKHLVSMEELQDTVGLIKFPKELHKADMFEET